MLLPLLLRPSLCCPRASPLLTGCSSRALRSQAEHFLRRQPPSRLVTRSRSRKSRSQEEEWKTRNKTVLTYIAAAGVGMIGLSYAAVPLYRLYCQVRTHTHTDTRTLFLLLRAHVTALLVCQASGLGGTAVAGHNTDQVATMEPVKERVIKVTFNADTHASIQWNFRPQQTEIFVRVSVHTAA